MSRVIKFRVWDGKSMHYGGFNIHASGKIQLECFIVQEAADLLKVMQFTGLTDKDGADTYEGDLIEWKFDRFIRVYQVYYLESQARFAAKLVNTNEKYDDDPNPWMPFLGNDEYLEDLYSKLSCGNVPDCSWSRIIGNIHQNSDLLK